MDAYSNAYQHTNADCHTNAHEHADGDAYSNAGGGVLLLLPWGQHLPD